MMIFAYDKDDIIATVVMLNDITVTATYYRKFIRSVLCPEIWKLQPEKTDSGAPILHDNGRLHVAQPVVDLFVDYAWVTLRHPLPDFHLFPKLKEPL